jgi:hypothetical protein
MGNGSVAITAAVPRAGGALSRTYHLLLAAQASHVSVREAADARLLPASCPDRHINSDGAFCLGLRADNLVDDAGAVHEWWCKLTVFLTCQETAHETRTWPEYAQMSHGNEAAEIQVEAEQLAREFGLVDEFYDAMWRREGLIAFVAKRIDPQTMHPRNGRAACVCGRTDKRGLPLLRRQCWKADLKCLPVLERQRQEEVKDFWARLGDGPCCGTMDTCPLRRASYPRLPAGRRRVI